MLEQRFGIEMVSGNMLYRFRFDCGYTQLSSTYYFRTSRYYDIKRTMYGYSIHTGNGWFNHI